VRKRLAIVGHSEEGLALIPLLEANPDVEVCAILTDDPAQAMRVLTAVEPALGERFADHMTSDPDRVLRTPGLVALIDAEPGQQLVGVLGDAPDHGIQVTTPLIAKLLYAFGPVDASRKPDLLRALAEILESYNLTVDRRGLLSRILQIAVGATGADRGSLMLYDETEERLLVEVAIGIEKEVIQKIRIRRGEGIAGRAFESGQAVLLHGKADHASYQIVRERDDVESAISAPLVHQDRILGVLNLSHGRRRGAFSQEDLQFVVELAMLDAKIITRAEEYHGLRRDSARLQAQSRVRSILGQGGPLSKRLAQICSYVSEELEQGLCSLYLYDTELDLLSLHASSLRLDPLSSPVRVGMRDGIHGWVARHRKPALLSQRAADHCACFTVIPLGSPEEPIGVLSAETVIQGQVPDLLHDKIAAIADALSEELSDALREARIEREATKMGAISESMAMMSATTESAELHRAITTSAAMILEAEHAVLRLQESATGRFQIRSYFGSAETDAQPQLFALEKELSIGSIQQQSSLRVIDIDTRGDLASYGTGISSALVHPLRRGEQIVGTLSVLSKVARDPLAGERFSEADQTVLVRLTEQVQHRLEQMQERETAKQQRRFDVLTGLANATHLRERLEEEIARCSEHGRKLVVIRFRLVGLDRVIEDQTETESDRLVLSVAQELRAGLRDFDVLARTSPDTFEIVASEPGAEASEIVGPLARRAREAIRREPDPSLGERLSLEFGYAVFPDEEHTAVALLQSARNSRIVSD
jgi:GAF domain-containing protein